MILNFEKQNRAIRFDGGSARREAWAMQESGHSQRQYDADGRPIEPTLWQKIKKFLAPVGVGIIIFFKYLAKLKFLLPFLKTGGTMILSIGAYALAWGWQFAVGFVLLIFVHECGHLLAAKRLGLKVGAPVFIPFMGAIIALKEAPRNAWVEADVGIGGPLLGAFGAAVCELSQRPPAKPEAWGRWSGPRPPMGRRTPLANVSIVGFCSSQRISQSFRVFIR